MIHSFHNARSKGKMLIDYRLMNDPGRKAVRSQMATPATLLEFLKANAGHLVDGA